MDTRARIVMFVAIVIPLLGYLVEVLLGKVGLRGYGHIARDLRLVGKTIHGKTERDGEDIVIRGNTYSWPISVRFSHSDQKPELNITMSVPSNLTLYCVPRKHSAIGRASLQSPDPRFEARYRLSTNHPMEASIAFSSDTLRQVERLCNTSSSSSSILLALQDRTLELSELTVPEDGLYQHVVGRMQVMAQIADATANMPGGATTKAGSGFARHWNWFRTAYFAVSILLMLSLLGTAFGPNKVPPSPPPAPLPAGISMEEAAQISDIQQWRLAQPVDFAPGALSWLQQRGSTMTGRIPVSFTNSATGGVAYILKRKDGNDSRSGRLVTFVDGQQRFDLALPQVALVARIPLDAIESIQWTGRAPVGQPDSDGILVVRSMDDPESATIFFFSGLHLLSGRPKDYQGLSGR